MAKYASKVVEQAKAWLGYNESDGTHKKIIDVYNTYKPHPRGYAVKYDDAWCATFVSAVAIKLGYTDIMPVECGCGQMLNLYKAKGAWCEDESRVPNPGDVIFYDWQDDGKGDNRGNADHVGIVEKVSNGKITIIEGNYSNSVKRRTLAVNGKNIRGYGVPKYDSGTATPETNTKPSSNEANLVTVKLNTLQIGSTGNQVKALQRMLYCLGYDLGTKPIDGSFGDKTNAAVRLYQKHNGLEIDGVVGQNTWNKLLGAK